MRCVTRQKRESNQESRVWTNRLFFLALKLSFRLQLGVCETLTLV